MSVYFDCISQAKPFVFVYCRQRKWKESFETWTGIWISKKTTAQTEENTASFVLQRLTTFRQTDSNLVCYDLLMSICILVVNRWNSLFAPHRWNSSRQEYVLRSTFYLVESSFAFCEELAHISLSVSSSELLGQSKLLVWWRYKLVCLSWKQYFGHSVIYVLGNEIIVHPTSINNHAIE